MQIRFQNFHSRIVHKKIVLNTKYSMCHEYKNESWLKEKFQTP